MEVIILSDPEAVCSQAARIVAALVRRRPRSVLGLATGETPKAMYAELVRMHREEGLDLRRVTTFNLDEYVGIAPEHPRSYHRYMREHFFDSVGLPLEQTHLPNGLAADISTACADYERAIKRAGGIELQILGLGADGHIGFNEPSSSLASRTRIKTLTDDTLARNGVDWGSGEVPRHVITMGVATILDARRCLLLACGDAKGEAVAGMVEGPLSAMNPASALQLHPHATVLIDEAAATWLRLTDYYRAVARHKPMWQRELDGD